MLLIDIGFHRGSVVISVAVMIGVIIAMVVIMILTGFLTYGTHVLTTYREY